MNVTSTSIIHLIKVKLIQKSYLNQISRINSKKLKSYLNQPKNHENPLKKLTDNTQKVELEEIATTRGIKTQNNENSTKNSKSKNKNTKLKRENTKSKNKSNLLYLNGQQHQHSQH